MARRPDRENAEILSEKDLKELRHNLAHLGITAVREFYEQAHRDCRLIYNRLSSPRQLQTLVQVWKQLRKWRLMRMNFATALRRDLAERALAYARRQGLPHCLSYGDAPVVCFPPDERDSQQGKFLPRS